MDTMFYNSLIFCLFQLCKARDGNDRYADRGMQTFNDAPKNKVVQTTKVDHVVIVIHLPVFLSFSVSSVNN